MALDALVDSAQLNTACMNTAYALKLQFPNQLSTGETIDWETGFGFARTIMALQAGGLVLDSVEMAWGSITPASNLMSEFTIAHGMSAAPDFAIVFAVPRPGSGAAVLLRFSCGDNEDGSGGSAVESGNVTFSANGGTVLSSTGDHRKMALTAQNLVVGASSQIYFEAGLRYYWLAYKAPVSGGM